jgi:hypothetical protein
MRLFDKIMSGKHPIKSPRNYKSVIPSKGDTQLIVADWVLSSITEKGGLLNLDMLGDFESYVLVPPFTNFAIEADRVVVLCTVEDAHEAKGSVQKIFPSAARHITDDTKWVYSFKAYINLSSYAILYPVEIVLPVDGDGKVSWLNPENIMDTMLVNDEASLQSLLSGADSDVAFQGSMRFLFGLVFYAITLMNCRNVELVDNPLNRQQRRRNEQGKGIKTHSYYTLKIKPMGKVYEPTGEGNKGNKHRLHIMRGHFKTYSDDAPLFGKFTGTYYWGASVRGNADKGTIKKDYEVVT